MLKKLIALGTIAVMLFAMGITSMAATSTTIYPRFCVDGEGYNSISMAQEAVDGQAVITTNEGVTFATITLKSFTATRGGFTGTGSVESVTVDNTTYSVVNNQVTIPVNYKLDDATVYTDVSLKLNISVLSGIFNVPTTQSADLYFSSSLAEYEAE